MSNKRSDKYLPLVVSLVELALGLKRTDVYAAETDTEINHLLSVKTKPKVIWFRGREDALYQFWLLRDKEALADNCWIIFTGIAETPLWRDLEEYVGGRMGSVYVLHYDSGTNVGVKPSQRGLYMRDRRTV